MISDSDSLSQIQSKIDANVISVHDLVLYHLRKIDEQNPTLNAFIEVFREEAISRANEIDQKIKSGSAGKLAGLVIGLKDNICFKSHTVTASSKILNGFVSNYNATVVERLLSEDAIIIGRLNCDEFAMGASNETSYYGPVKNAANINRVPGGSSGGSAVAVQANMCQAALGSDTGGSIRQPAAFCGNWGFKPSYGTVSRYGLLAYASSFDQIGPITKNSEDLVLLMSIIAGPDNFDPTMKQNQYPQFNLTKSTNKQKFAVIRDCIEHDGIDPEIKNHTLELMEHLKKQGHLVELVDFPMLDLLVPCYYVLTTAEASSNLARYSGLLYGYRSPNAADLNSTFTRSRSEGFGTEVKRRIMLGTFVLSSNHYDAYYTKAQKVRNLIKMKTDELFAKYDFILTPTTSTPAFELGEKSKDPIAMYLADLFTVHANIVGIPAISIPTAVAKNKMPFGMQLMAPMFKDNELIHAAQNLYTIANELN